MFSKPFALIITAKRIWLCLIGIVAISSLLYLSLLEKPVATPAMNILDNYVIAVDPGHGGIDSGSSHAGVTEKDITLLISEAIADEITAQGGSAILTRTTDDDLWSLVTIQEEIEITKKEYLQDQELGRSTDPRDRGIALGTRYPPTYRLGLRARLLIAHQNKADILISIHTNHFRSASAHGSVTLYQAHSPQSKQLAMSIQKHLTDLLPGRSGTGIIADNFFILRRAGMPAVLIEIGFVSNSADRAIMLSESGRQAIATAVVNGINEYFAQQKDVF